MKKNENKATEAIVKATEAIVNASETSDAGDKKSDGTKNTEAPKKALTANEKARAACERLAGRAPKGLTVRQYTDADVVRDSNGNAAARVNRLDLQKNLFACTDSRRSYAGHIVTAKSRAGLVEQSNRFDVFELIFGRDARIACNDMLREVIVKFAKKENITISEKYFRKFDLKWQITVPEEKIDDFVNTIYEAYVYLQKKQAASEN